MKTLILILASLALPAQARADSFGDLIEMAEAAGPAELSSEAAIYYRDPDGVVLRVREGTNGWWCMAPSLAHPGPKVPLCGDAASLDWVMAWLNGEEPTPGLAGVVYALAGGRDASLENPHALGPVGNRPWIVTGPHVMIVNDPAVMKGYPSSFPTDTTQPYAMWTETPFAHLRLPLD